MNPRNACTTCDKYKSCEQYRKGEVIITTIHETFDSPDEVSAELFTNDAGRNGVRIFDDGGTYNCTLYKSFEDAEKAFRGDRCG